MSLTKAIPKIIYDDISVGVSLFTALGFEVKYSEEGFYIFARDNVTIYIAESGEDFHISDRPEFRIETDDIDGYYTEIKAKSPHILHPNLKVIKNQPWGLREFAVRDETSVCIIFHQHINP